MKKEGYGLVSGVTLLYLIWSFFILQKNQMPPIHDASVCYSLAQRFFSGLFVNPRVLIGNSNYYPPLYMLCVLPFFKLFSASPTVMALANTVYFAILVFSLYKICRLSHGPAGHMAAILALCVPVIVGYYRVTHLVTAVTALVSLWFYFLLRTCYFTDRKYVLACGAAAGTGMLFGFHFACYAGGITAVYAVLALAAKRDTVKKIKNIAVFTLVCLFVMSIWYVPAFIGGNLREIFYAQCRPRSGSLPPRGYLDLLSAYGRYFYQALLAPLFFFFVISPVVLCRRKTAVHLVTVCLLGWIAIPVCIMLFFRFPPNTRYLLPLVPAAIILTACAAQEILKNASKPRLLLTGCIGACALVFSFHLQYSYPRNSRELMDEVLNYGILSAHPFDPRVSELVDYLKEAARGEPCGMVTIMSEDLDPAPLEFEFLKYRLGESGLRIKNLRAMSRRAGMPREKRERFLRSSFDKARFLLYVQTAVSADTTRPDYDPASNRMLRGLLNYADKRLLRVFVDPEGFFTGALFLYEKDPGTRIRDGRAEEKG